MNAVSSGEYYPSYQKTVWGIDGCRAGWLAVSLSNDGSTRAYLLRTHAELLELFHTADRILIDMPIGLSEQMPTRTCDRLLRQALGNRYASSVFSPPVRAAVYAHSYAEACELNAAIAGKKISKQTWFITAKIRQIDTILRQYPALRHIVYESHPELLFQRLHQLQPLIAKKRSLEGKQIRLQLLAEVIPTIHESFASIRQAYARKDVADDDCLDALVLAYFAQRSMSDGLVSLPNPPEYDACAIAMSIHFV
jgi:predicted RNase H-like nuclease